jgi:thioredoxin-like negative regulator of GroEL
LIRVLTALGRGDDLLSATEAAPRTRWIEAARLYASGEFAGAAELYGQIGSAVDEADARLRAAEQLAEAGRREEAEAQLERALTFYRSVGATRYVREGEDLLAASA